MMVTLPGKACHPGDADCLGDETDDSYFYSFIYMCHIFLLCVVRRESVARPRATQFFLPKPVQVLFCLVALLPCSPQRQDR